MRLSRLLALIAVLACASVTAQAHVGPFGSAAETARRGFLPDLGTASRDFARVTAGRVRENYDCARGVASGSCVDAFGVEIGRSGTTEVEHLYRSERWDANVAAYDLRARLYSPGNGRFLTQDSFAGFSQDPQSLHKYAYTHNNPVNSIDPSGHFSMAEVGTSLRVMGHLAAIGIPTYNAVNNLRAGASLGETTLRFAAEVTIGYAGGAVLGRLTRFLPPILRIRSAGSLVPAGGRSSQSMWNLGIYGRGEAAELAVLGGQRTLPWNYPVIDDFAGGFATSIKSMDLIGKSSSYIRSQMMAAAGKLATFVPRNYGAGGQLAGRTVNGRNLVYVFEPGAADAAQATLLKQIAKEVKAAYPDVKLAFQWVP
jgi:RHS repeat-associated protein